MFPNYPKFSFALDAPAPAESSSEDRSRTGTLCGRIPTPTFSLPSRRGMPLTLTYEAIREVVGKDTPYLLNVPLGDIAVDSGRKTLTGDVLLEKATQGETKNQQKNPNAKGVQIEKEKVTESPIGFREFVGESNVDENVVLYLGFRDGLHGSVAARNLAKNEGEITGKKSVFQADPKPTEVVVKPNVEVSSPADKKEESNSKNKKQKGSSNSVAMDKTIHGRQTLENPEEVAAVFAKKMGFQVAAQPSDEADFSVGKNRSQRAGERTRDALTTLKDSESSVPMLASIQGGFYGIQRRIFTQTVASIASKNDQSLAGFIIGGLGHGESTTDRKKVLSTVASNLELVTKESVAPNAASKPRFLPLSLGSPLEVLDACIDGGIDVFELSFPFEMANQGIALTFDVEKSSAGCEKQPWALNLNCLEYESDFKFIEDSIAETKAEIEKQNNGVKLRENFTRAYLHHLLSLNELLATMVLTRHNLRKYWDFFAEIRKHAKNGSLREYREWFVRNHSGVFESEVVFPAVSDKTSAKIGKEKVGVKDGRDKRKGDEKEGTDESPAAKRVKTE